MNFGRTHKVPLNGSDCMMLAFDRQMRRLGFAGNQAQIMLGLSGRLTGQELKNRVHAVGKRFPILGARIKRRTRPWWFYNNDGKKAPGVYSHEASSETELHTIKRDILNRPLDAGKGDLIRFDIVGKAEGTEVIMTWSHLLMDVHGAQYLLGILGNSVPEAEQYDQEDLLSGSYTQRLPEGPKLRMAKKSFARVDELAACPPVSLYTHASAPIVPRFDYRVASFSREQTGTISALAETKSGFLNTSAYYAAAAVGQFHKFLQSREVLSPGCVVPISVDLRKKGTRMPVFTNQSVTLLCGFQPDRLQGFNAIQESFKEQTRTAVREELIESNVCAIEIARFVPSRIYAARILKAFSGEIGSLVFANQGEAPDFLYKFMGYPVKSLYHVPTVVVPPGMGLVFYNFSGRLHVTLVYVESLISPEEAGIFLKALGDHLLSGSLK